MNGVSFQFAIAFYENVVIFILSSYVCYLAGHMHIGDPGSLAGAGLGGLKFFLFWFKN